MVLTMRMKAPAGMTTGFLPDGVKLTADANGYVNCPKEFIGNLLSAGFTIETGEFSSIISSVAFVGNDMVFTLADLSTLTLTGAKTALKGADGANGSNGTNAYVYIAYASDDQGTDFTLTFNAALDYIAIKHTTTAISSPVVTDFAGLWKNYNGANGSNGTNAYVYIAYASDDQGTDFTLTFNAALDYIAIKHTTTAISSPVVTDFAGLWKNYKGAPGGA